VPPPRSATGHREATHELEAAAAELTSAGAALAERMQILAPSVRPFDPDRPRAA